MLVSDVMGTKGPEIIQISPDASIADAARLLREKKIGFLVVCNDKGFVVGVFSERDIVRAVAERLDDIAGLTVQDVFTADVVTCSPGDDAEEVMGVLHEMGIRHIPVLKFGKPVGLLSSRDLLKYRLNLLEEERSEFAADYADDEAAADDGDWEEADAAPDGDVDDAGAPAWGTAEEEEAAPEEEADWGFSTDEREEIVWVEEMSVGIDALDEDHKALIYCLNEFIAAVDRGDSVFITDTIFSMLLDYTKYHFGREENVMEACDYADIDAHIKAHDALQDRLGELREEFLASPNTGLSDEVRDFLTTWLQDHIMKTDHAYRETVAGREVEIAEALAN